MNRWLDTLLLVLALALLHLLLRQSAIHHLDMHVVVRALAAPPGEATSYNHFGFMWLAMLLHWLVGDRPGGVFAALQWSCALGGALAAGASHRACLSLGCGRRQALEVAAAAALVPGVLHFATVAEIHAVFLLPAHCAFWALACWHRSRRLRAAAITGACLGLAAAMHTTGHLLLPLFALGIWLATPLPRRAALAPIAVVLAADALLFLALRAADRRLFGWANESATVAFLQETLGRWQGFAAWPAIFWREWLRPMAPWSLLFLLAAVRRDLRPWVLLMTAAVLGWSLLSLALLVGLVEHGAYAVPIVLPAVALAAAVLPHRLLTLALLLGASFAVMHVRDQDPERIPTPGFAQALDRFRLAHPHTAIVLGSYREIDSVLVYGAPCWHHTLQEPVFQPLFAADAPMSAVRAAFAAMAGKSTAVFVSADALATLLPNANVPTKAVLDEIRSRNGFTLVRDGELSGAELQLPPR